MSSRRLFSLVVAAASVVACGSRTDLAIVDDGGALPSTVDAARDARSDDGTESSTPALADGTVATTCGPTDGPATVLTFTAGPLACAVALPADYDQINLYAELPGPGPVSFTPSGPNGAGDAQSCMGTVCVEATHVTLDVTEYSPTGTAASGEYTLVLANGTTVSKTFVVNMCPAILGCG